MLISIFAPFFFLSLFDLYVIGAPIRSSSLHNVGKAMDSDIIPKGSSVHLAKRTMAGETTPRPPRLQVVNYVKRDSADLTVLQGVWKYEALPTPQSHEVRHLKCASVCQ